MYLARWQAMPADTTNPDVARNGERGQWWALYYTGVKTLVTIADDMRDRAQLLCAHAFTMRGMSVPPHAPALALEIVSAKGGTVLWSGSAGAADYSIERSDAGGAWKTVCDRCVTDVAASWTDPAPAGRASYRVIPFNLDGKAGSTSVAKTED